MHLLVQLFLDAAVGIILYTPNITVYWHNYFTSLRSIEILPPFCIPFLFPILNIRVLNTFLYIHLELSQIIFASLLNIIFKTQEVKSIAFFPIFISFFFLPDVPRFPLLFFLTNSLSLPLSENTLIFSFIAWKYIWWTQGWQVISHLKNTPLPSGLHGFLWEIRCHSKILFYIRFSLAICKIFSLISRSFTIMCLIADYFGFILFSVHLHSLICKFMLFAKFGKCLAIIFLSTSSVMLSFPSLSKTPTIQMSAILL